MQARVVVIQLASLSCVFALPAIGNYQEDVETAFVVRGKRNPSRSYTFSGFMPGSGMSAFASSADFAPYYPRRPAREPAGWSPEGDDHGRPSGEPATVEHPPERGGADKPWANQPDSKDKGEEAEEEEEEEDPVTRPPKKNKKKHKPHQVEGDEEEYDKPSRGGSGGNAAASFNAWFPIMLGMFPGQGADGFRGGYGAHDAPARPSHTTVIANSVSHGRSGVASSHAVAYGGQQSSNPHGR